MQYAKLIMVAKLEMCVVMVLWLSIHSKLVFSSVLLLARYFLLILDVATFFCILSTWLFFSFDSFVC